MKTTSRQCMLAAVILFFSSHIFADTLIVDIDTTITEVIYYDHILVTPTGNLVADSAVNVTGDMIIQPGGRVRHSHHNLDGLQLNIGGTLWIQRNTETWAAINVNYRGLWGGGQGGRNEHGETYDANGNIVDGSRGSNGGAYGGRGGTGNSGGTHASAYGLADSVYLPGGGGGSEYVVYNPGGNGGGLVRINADTVIVDGEIAANGESISPNCGVAYGHVGGGAGGGIFIKADVLRGGEDGFISAFGGTGACENGGGGGGGRITIHANDYSEFEGPIYAYGGNNDNNANLASPGTVFLRPSRHNASVPGELWFDNFDHVSLQFTPVMLKTDSLSSLIVTGSSTVSLSADTLSIVDSLWAIDNALFRLENNASMTFERLSGTDMHLSGGSVEVYSGSSIDLDQIIITSGTFYTEASLSFSDPTGVQLSGSGVIQLRDSSVFTIPVFSDTNMTSGTFDIGSEASLDVQSDEIIVSNGLTLFKNGFFGDGAPGSPDEIGAFTISPGGLVRHSYHHLDGLILNVSGNLWIQRDASTWGQINVNYRGLWGGGQGGRNEHGETYDVNGNIVDGSRGSNGGAHGGKGGTGYSGGTHASPYGVADSVYLPGSGGGAEYVVYNPGGNGGGLVRINADTVIVDGEIAANGQSISPNCGVAYGQVGGGAGGGISITANALRGGADAFIWAIGGNGACTNAGGGGGGRIAVHANEYSEYLGDFFVYGGTNDQFHNRASAGTIFFSDKMGASGHLLISNENLDSAQSTPALLNSASIYNLEVKDYGRFSITSEVHIQNDVHVSNNGRLVGPQ